MYKNIAYVILFVIFGVIIFMSVLINERTDDVPRKNQNPIELSEDEIIETIFKEELNKNPES